MLHIIFLILKILGFLLLGVIALVLLLLLVVLLSPFAYRADITVDNSLESLKGHVRFHWLMHLLSGQLSYEDGVLTWSIRAAWKKMSSEDDELPNGAGKGPDEERAERRPDEEKAERGPDEESDGNKTDARRAGSRTDQDRADSDTASPAAGGLENERTDEPGAKVHGAGDSAGTDNAAEDQGQSRKVSERIQKIWGKIKYTFEKICDKIRSLRKKKEKIEAFLNNEIHRNAFARLLKETKRLLRSLAPQAADIDLEFGFSDPALTGYTLAGISMIYPFIGPCTQIRPDFEQKVLRGSAAVRGRIRLIRAVVFAWNMFVDRDVRITFRRIKKFRL